MANKSEPSSTPSTSSGVTGEKKPCCKKKAQQQAALVRPSELPLYGNPYPPQDVLLSDESGAIETGIREVRHTATPYYTMIAAGGRRGMEFLATAISHSKSLYGRIRDESSAIPKAAAITAGGLTGLLFASRKGFIRKILYTSFGLTAAAAACYPEQSKELIDLSAYIARRRGPDLIKEITGVDVSPYLDLKKLDRIKSTDESSKSPSPDREEKTITAT